MKQYTTRILKTLAALFLIFPLFYLTWIVIVFNISINSVVEILLSFSFYLISFAVMMAGYGLWEMRRWSWHVFLLSQMLVFYENAYFILHYSESHYRLLAFLITVFLQLALVYRVSKEIRVPYFFPKIRWWESNPRYRLSIPVTLLRKEQEIQTGEILDLSLLGCFIKFREDFTQDEPVKLQFKIFGYELSCEGRVVWVTQSAVTHPKGIGVKFDPLSKMNRRALRAICRRLRKIAAFYRRSRYLMNQDEFIAELEKLETPSNAYSNLESSSVAYNNK